LHRDIPYPIARLAADTTLIGKMTFSDSRNVLFYKPMYVRWVIFVQLLAEIQNGGNNVCRVENAESIRYQESQLMLPKEGSATFLSTKPEAEKTDALPKGSASH
jgi:hypothetical protein